MASEAAHGFENVVAYLRSLKAKGTFGTTELVWRGHDVLCIRHQETYKPGELPQSVTRT